MQILLLQKFYPFVINSWGTVRIIRHYMSKPKPEKRKAEKDKCNSKTN